MTTATKPTSFQVAKAKYFGLTTSAVTLGAGALVAIASGGFIVPTVIGTVAVASALYAIRKNLHVIEGKAPKAASSNKKSSYLVRQGKSLAKNGLKAVTNLSVGWTGLALIVPAIIFGVTATPLVLGAAIVGTAMAATGAVKALGNVVDFGAGLFKFERKKKAAAPEKAIAAQPAAAPSKLFDETVKPGFDKAKDKAVEVAPVEKKTTLDITPPKPPAA